ncbi:hemolysin family protein [Halomarina salina]|uniref:Hemolysin family protein n=1 Tax=Halomarina salina TaxID=1872699 RepID=A0ABD5RMT9_9EURY|nr:hemolysin family protein [Halomarina salina]
MVDPVIVAARLGLALVLVVLNGFFVAAEFAFVRLRSTSVDTLVSEGRRSAPLVKEATDNLNDYLAVCQLGITIASLGLGWVGEPAIAAVLEPALSAYLPESGIHTVSVAIGFGVITFLHVVYGELAPKTLAIQEAERIALLVAPLMKVFYYLFLPAMVVFNGTANLSTRLVGVEPAAETDESHTEEEILAILTESGAAGEVDTEEVLMIRGVFDLDDTPVREIMRPRPDVMSVPADTPLPELRSRVVDADFTRFPVVEEDGEQVVGFIDVKDILRIGESFGGDDETVTARDLAREILVVPETLYVDELLEEFQTEQRQMAAIIDEWGTFEGLVTVEDVVEEIVGDIRDQFDVRSPEPAIERLDDGGYAIDGGVTLTEVNETLDVAFESDAFETVGGLVLDRLGRAPDPDDSVEIDGYRIRVTEVDGARIVKVVVHPV